MVVRSVLSHSVTNRATCILYRSWVIRTWYIIWNFICSVKLDDSEVEEMVDIKTLKRDHELNVMNL